MLFFIIIQADDEDGRDGEENAESEDAEDASESTPEDDRHGSGARSGARASGRGRGRGNGRGSDDSEEDEETVAINGGEYSRKRKMTRGENFQDLIVVLIHRVAHVCVLLVFIICYYVLLFF